MVEIDESPRENDVFFDSPQKDDEGFKRPKPTVKKVKQDHVDDEIARYRSSTERLIKKLPFTRMVRDISVKFSGVNELGNPTLSWHVDALNALHESAEQYLVELFEDSYTCSNHAKRKTLYREDVQLVRKLRGRNGSN